MRVVITGASGFIGTALVRSLRGDGHEILPLVRGARRGEPAGAVRWDPVAGTIDRDALEGVDAMVHLAAAGIGDRRWTRARKRVILESRTQGTSLIARTLAELDRPPRVLLSASGINVYGDGGDTVLTETSPPGDGFLAGVCVAWEQATGPAAAAGIRTVCTRSGLVLAGHGGNLSPMLRLFRLGLGGRFGSGRQWMSWISLDDEVGAMRFLLEREDVAGPVNLTAPGAVTNRDFGAALARALHRPAVLWIPRFAPRLVRGEVVDELLFASLRVRPAALEAAGYEFTHPDLAGALAAILGTEVVA